MNRRILSALMIAAFAIGLAACGDTWRGVQKDTGENMEKTGEAIEGAGEKVKT